MNDLEQQHFPQGSTPDMIKLLDDVQELLSKAYQAGYETAHHTVPQAWSNQAAFGYTILAAEMNGMSEDGIHCLVRRLHRTFDEVSLEEAAERYRTSIY